MAVFKGPAHIGIHTRDMERSKAFYIENLGFKLEYEAVVEKPGNQWLKLSFLRLGEMVIELLEPPVIPDLFNGIMTAFLKGPSGERIELVEHMEV